LEEFSNNRILLPPKMPLRKLFLANKIVPLVPGTQYINTKTNHKCSKSLVIGQKVIRNFHKMLRVIWGIIV
jgi:hypothetical protein